ncbi:hypothetical protein [Micromonospora fulviviridis]|uniref:hypothetical protein n=1 Tax=Micromonospora fulviviridis TaxID=47860 RepID=UPI0037AA9A3B
MNSTPTLQTIGERTRSFVGDVLRPPSTPTGSPRRILAARQITAVVGSLATLIQVVIWLLIGVIGGDLDSPWWLLTAVATTAVVGGLTVADGLVADIR